MIGNEEGKSIQGEDDSFIISETKSFLECVSCGSRDNFATIVDGDILYVGCSSCGTVVLAIPLEGVVSNGNT